MEKLLKHTCENEREEVEKLKEAFKNKLPTAIRDEAHLVKSKFAQIQAENEELYKCINETSKPMFPETSTNKLLEEDVQSLKNVVEAMVVREGDLREKIALLNEAIRDEQNIDISDFKDEQGEENSSDDNDEIMEAQTKLFKLAELRSRRSSQLESVLDKFSTPGQEDFKTDNLPDEDEDEILPLKRVLELLISAKKRDSKNPWIEVTRGIHPSCVNLLLQCRIICRHEEYFNLIGLQDDMSESE